MRRGPEVLLVAICVANGSLWLLPDHDVSPAWQLLLLTAVLMLLTLLAGAVLSYSHSATQLLIHNRWRLVLSGAGCVSVPTVLLVVGREYLNGLMAVAIQAGVPIIVMIASGAVGTKDEAESRLLPALVALAGTLLVLPVALPNSNSGWFGLGLFALAACITAVSSVICHEELVATSPMIGFFLVAVGNTVVLLVASLVALAAGRNWAPPASVLSATSLLFGIISAGSIAAVLLALRLLPAQAAAARFVFTPLVAATEAYVLMRPTLSIRTMIGAAFMLAGGIACVSGRGRNQSHSMMSLR